MPDEMVSRQGARKRSSNAGRSFTITEMTSKAGKSTRLFGFSSRLAISRFMPVYMKKTGINSPKPKASSLATRPSSSGDLNNEMSMPARKAPKINSMPSAWESTTNARRMTMAPRTLSWTVAWESSSKKRWAAGRRR